MRDFHSALSADRMIYILIFVPGSTVQYTILISVYIWLAIYFSLYSGLLMLPRRIRTIAE